MTKRFGITVALVLTLGLGGLAASALAEQPAKAGATTATHHGHEVKGIISAYDEGAKTLTVKDAAGKETEFSLTTATAVHGALKVDEKATVRYMIKNGKNVATSVRVTVPAAVPAAPAK